MANSSYYYDKYKAKKKEISKYDNNLEDLQKILNNFHNLYDEKDAVNTELSELRADLKQAIRYNREFNINADSFESKKEKSVDSDTYLKESKESIESEISRIKGLRTKAISDRDYYYNKYEQKKQEESEARRKAVADFFDKLF